MQLAKIENGQLITTYADDEDKDIINQIITDGFKYYVEESAPDVTLSEFQTLEPCFREEPHQIVSYYKVVDNSPERISAEIERLKAELSATDYQIIKSYEYTLTGQPLPYTLSELHSERQALRNRINELEKLC